MERALALRVYMNSSMEAVLNFKTACCLKLFDQNLEIHVINRSTEPVSVNSYIDLEGEQGVKRIDNLFPSGLQLIGPGDAMAFYGYVDDLLWEASRTLVFYDAEGNRYTHPIGECQDGK